jgi:alkylation response protein AidB-like acyl-CoA dehydrogenase
MTPWPHADLTVLDFLTFDWLCLNEVLERPIYKDHDEQGIRLMIDQVSQILAQEFSANTRVGDLNEPYQNAQGEVITAPFLKQAINSVREAGLFVTGFSADEGGLGLPMTVHMTLQGLMMGANIGAAAFGMLTMGNAKLIQTFGTSAQIKAFAEPAIKGDFMGTMCLSEPQAGSSLADITTKAVFECDHELGAQYRLFGSKMWISAGDHDLCRHITHLVLAKIPNHEGRVEASTKSISLFIVPKIIGDGTRNDVSVSGLNHKMGYRTTPNCYMNFGAGDHLVDDRAGAVGYLIGQPGQGLMQMFLMMNEARISVGLGAAMLSWRGFHEAKAYAATRLQGRLIGGAANELVSIDQHSDVKRQLLIGQALSEGGLALCLFGASLLEDEFTHPDPVKKEEAKALLALLIPLIKTFPSEMGQEALSQAIQTCAGAGYTRDMIIEQLYRDNRLNPIHEGTTGIQGLDLVMRKIKKEGLTSYEMLRKRIEATLSEASSEFPDEVLWLRRAWERLDEAAHQISQTEPTLAAAHATAFLMAMGHGVVGWIWLWQMVSETKLARAKPHINISGLQRQRVGRAFLILELPRIESWLFGLLEGLDPTL